MKKTIVLVLAFFVISCSKKEIQYSTFEVVQKDLARQIEANGSIESTAMVDIISPTSGRIEKVFVLENDRVRAGQKIMTVSSDARNNILDMALSKGQEELEYWKKQMLPTPVYAPASGKVINIQRNIGERVRGSIAQISTGEIVRANIDEADLPYIVMGQKVEIYFDISPKSKLSGILSQISSTSKLVNNINVYQVEVSLPEEAQRKKLPFEVKLGMSVTLYFRVQEKKGALALSLDAVDGQSRKSVTMLKADGSKVKVKLGDSYGEWVEVLSGLELQEEVKVPKFSVEKQKMKSSPLFRKE